MGIGAIVRDRYLEMFFCHHFDFLAGFKKWRALNCDCEAGRRELLLFNSRPPQWRRYFLALLLDGRYYLELLYYVDISTVDGTTLTMREEISAVIRRTAAWSQRHQGSTMSKKYGCNGIEREGKKR